ncbi:choice-of-anchor A family protein [Aliiglaciecola sp. 3_MG-2023]|uniref:choice-of-anchor A family protein n=1 Tax=Aliiglaciecola sp. 3_MG-2023 TaxID=3062644 RepID=UPI0026E22D59|nr:choice-of-anchor A family protein [Aliiglaciecola sp. 3_MG-2023]MDO6694850.1 choice-of-anchor A family protein [Aliiglaciecola sp. 3_MG-2023]
MKLVKSLFAFAVLASLSGAATATSGTIGKYNLLLLGDYNFSGGDVQGQSFIGGDLNSSNPVEFGSRLANTDTAIDAVTIVGDLNANRVRVLRDNNLVYGGDLNGTAIELNDGDDGQLIHDSSLTVADIKTELYADTAYFAGLSSTGSFSSGNFDYAGSENMAVFDVSAADIFAQNSNLSMNWGSAETVIINVSGTDINIGGGVNLNNGFNGDAAFSNIVWNFFEATNIDFNGLASKGSVLAPYADTSGGASFDGSFAAVSYTGAREFHNYTFDYTPPTSTKVAEPSLFGLMLLSGLLVIRKRRIKS